METPQDPPPPQPPKVSWARYLIERRVPHIVAIYAGASWALVEFTAFATDEFLLSPHWTRMVLVTLVLMLPTVVMLAWFHGKPGRDRDSLARTERMGIPANVVLCVVALWTLFGGEDLRPATTTRTVETEVGDIVQRVVPRPGSLKSTALFPLALGPGIGEDESWVSYAVPEALVLDLMADDFFVPLPFFGWESYARELGFASFGEAPLALKRELAQERYAGFMATGEIDRANGLYSLTLRVIRVDDGSLAGEITREGTDLLALVDSVSGPVKTALGIPARESIEDLPVRGRLSENDAAVEAFFRGLYSRFHDRSDEAAEDYLTTATTLDPTFTVAQYTLSEVLRVSRDDEAAAVPPLLAAMDNLYRMPERYGFRVKADYYRLTGDMDRAAAVVEMWVELYPNDLDALQARVDLQRSSGDWEGVLATLATMHRLDPLDGDLLLELARAHEELGNDDQALAALTEYVERFPGDTYGYWELAEYHLRRGEHDEARGQLERAVLLDPLLVDHAIQLAGINLDVGRFDEAEAGLGRALELSRTWWDSVEVLKGRGRYHQRRGEMADAIRAIEARQELQSGDRSPTGMAIGQLEDIPTYLDAGRVGEAVALLTEVRARFQSGWIPSRLPHMTVRVALEVEGVDAALEAHREAMQGMEANEVLAGLADGLGLIRERAGDYAGAAESFREAIALSPETEYHRGAGRALRKAGRLDEAEAELREVLRLVPADPHALFEMALLMEARGDIEDAVEHLRSALAAWENADETFEPAREARAKLAELEGV